VLLNLVINSCEAMAGMPIGARRLSVSTAPGETGDVRVTVSDMGAGIPADQLTEIFEPFVTTKQNGLGLGLSICRTIVEAHGGRIWADGVATGGTAFHFTVPLAALPETGGSHD
jgi:two-component system sensor kinase FixL